MMWVMEMYITRIEIWLTSITKWLTSVKLSRGKVVFLVLAAIFVLSRLDQPPASQPTQTPAAATKASNGTTPQSAVAKPIRTEARPTNGYNSNNVPYDFYEDPAGGAAYLTLYVGRCGGKLPRETRKMVELIILAMPETVMARGLAFEEQRETIGNALFCGIIRKNFAKLL